VLVPLLHPAMMSASRVLNVMNLSEMAADAKSAATARVIDRHRTDPLRRACFRLSAVRTTRVATARGTALRKVKNFLKVYTPSTVNFAHNPRYIKYTTGSILKDSLDHLLLNNLYTFSRRFISHQHSHSGSWSSTRMRTLMTSNG